MKLFEYQIIAKIDDQEVELYIMDKYRVYTNASNKDVYLCRDKNNIAHTIHPSSIIKFV